MKKLLPFFLPAVLLVFAIGLLNCGTNSVAPQKAVFGFMTEAPTGSAGPYQPVIGTIRGNTFTASLVKDSSGKPVTAEFRSLILSSDGKKGVADIYTANPETYDIVVGLVDGSKAINITNDTYFNALPQFTPDNKKVIFLSDRGTQSWWDTMIANADGTGGLVNLSADSAICHHEPAMSPDGKKIAFSGHGHVGGVDYYYNIYVMDADGKNPVNLTKGTDTNIVYRYPPYSPDGKQIVYSRLDHSGSTHVWDIYVMNADGTNPKALTTSGKADMARFLPDGTLVFMNEKDGNAEIYRMKADGTNVTRLTNNSVYDGFCDDWYSGIYAPQSQADGHHNF